MAVIKPFARPAWVENDSGVLMPSRRALYVTSQDSSVALTFTDLDNADDPAGVGSTQVDLSAAGGGGGSLSVTDGTTTVDPVTAIDFASGATVTDDGNGTAQVDISGGSSGTTGYDVVLYLPTPPLGQWLEIADVVNVQTSNVWTIPAAAYAAGLLPGIKIFNFDTNVSRFVLGMTVWDAALDNWISLHGFLDTPSFDLRYQLGNFTMNVEDSNGADLTYNDGDNGVTSAAGGQYAIALGLQIQ